MLRLVTLKDCKNNPVVLKNSIRKLRHTFSSVFSNHYAKRLATPLKQAIDAQEVKEPQDLKNHSNPILQGFSDLLGKKHFFPKELKEYNETELNSAFQKIYSGPGFDDEEAFLLAFHDLSESKTAKDHYEKIKTRLKNEDQTEVEDYLKCLEKKECELKEVNFLALADNNNTIRGFVIFHIFQQKEQTIIHVRQAAMCDQGHGHVGLITRYLCDHYPKAIYEANQRKANLVLMKEKLLDEKLIQKTEAVLGYNKDYYFGLRGNGSLVNLFMSHHQNNPAQIGLKRFGRYHEAESVTKFFSQTKLNRESLALQDDNYCKDKLILLRRR